MLHTGYFINIMHRVKVSINLLSIKELQCHSRPICSYNFNLGPRLWPIRRTYNNINVNTNFYLTIKCLQNTNKYFHSSPTLINQNNTTNTAIMTPSAGLIIIGDEILRGQTQDTNTTFLTKNLHKLGIKVEKVSMIPDKVDAIAKEVALFSEKFTYVITSGGIGPTHDDKTFEGIAAAFGEKVYPHPGLAFMIKQYFKTDDLTSAAMKMAHIPESAELHYGEDKIKGIKSKFPVMTVKNVTVFPGIPQQLEKSFTLLSEKLFHSHGARFCSSETYLTADEVSIAPMLNKTVDKFPDVSIGSYPKIFHSYYSTRITMESMDQNQVDNCEEFFRNQLPPGLVTNYNVDTITSPMKYIDDLILATTPSIKEQLQEALHVLTQCLEKYKPEEICVCYNGGKDCLAVLHLSYAMMKTKYPNLRLQAIYIQENNSFPQLTEFVHQSINRYDLDCEILQSPMKDALTTLLQRRPNIKVTIMGTRRSDPYSGQLEFFSETDGDWPLVMRVNPLLNWTYQQIWGLIRGLYLPYCNLYDRGFTSLGNQDNTLPNPALQTTTRGGDVAFHPAYMLTQDNLERKGRITSKH